ncbi:MAG TPA: double-strand break repair helicase AddA [Xanthobacteraceae bacterium]|nr:double-strand break repair helicase AddA [Xanthobacteraceae bacterium]
MSRVIPQSARERQLQASDPGISAFVSANAGSGKTHVLVQRVIRLLLQGVAPEKILCITFTKAAAANMAERVFTTLGHWITLDNAALDAAIKETGAVPSDRTRRRARKLFASALDTPGGLKVQTIHALCTRLLQTFPFEANVPAHFSVLDDRDQADMMERASLKVLLAASANPDSPEGRALLVAMASAADVTFRDVVRDACLGRNRLTDWLKEMGGIEQAVAAINRMLGLAPDDTLEDIDEAFVNGPHLPLSEWPAISALCDTGTANDQKQGIRLREAFHASGDVRIDNYLKLFIGTNDQPRKSLVTKGLAKAEPRLESLLAAEQERVLALLSKRRAVHMREKTRALITIAAAVAQNYVREKQARGLLDYDDLIDNTLDMLGRVSSSWVHYKLDRGVDHVLIDEAQDTSPRQWEIISHLISEFTSGDGARGQAQRTIFAVGDEKQSIFSFQGAEPREFDSRRRLLRRQFEGAGLRFDPIAFTYSFRSGPEILHSVDQVFREQEIFRSIHAAENGQPLHQALSDAAPSIIELWPLEEKEQRPEIEGWSAPFDAVSETSPEVRLARRIQRSIKSLIDARTPTGLPHKRRPLRYGDILILVRRRSKVFDAIIQALKHADIPVAGADRLKLTEHIAVIDLINLADALLLRHDDLALAVALKSPLFGLDDDDLFKLAYGRKGALRDALDAQADADPRWAQASRRLKNCETIAARDTPFGFFAWLLGGDGGRERILKRLGPEANDALDEFLELALSYERRAPASLQGFINWLRATDIEVKRDMEITRDEVRVMTVHGAKGLEAPVVYLADTTSSPADSQRVSLIRLADKARGSGSHPGIVWAGRKADDPEPVAQARAAMVQDTEDEYRRLLYVAMTRAAERLIVGGCLPGNRKEVRERSWYDLIDEGLQNCELTCVTVETPDGPVRRFARAEVAAEAALPTSGPAAADERESPSWLFQKAGPGKREAEWLSPSRASVSDRAGGKATGAPSQSGRQRGIFIHRLLQTLPELEPDRRRGAAENFLARHAQSWAAEDRLALVDQVFALMADARFAPLFAQGSRAEVPIVGRLTLPDGTRRNVSGQIDRLVVTPSSVLILDFKTDRQPPASSDRIPAAYRQQLALYRAVLAQLYPDRPVRAALLYTETPELFELPGAHLEAALATIIPA